MKRFYALMLALVAFGSVAHAQTLRQLPRSAATLGDSSLTFTSDTVSSKITFATRAASIAQLRKALSKFAFDSVVVGSGPIRANGATVLTSNLTYGGVTLNNAVTGTGNMVLSASPTLTGTVVLTGTTITGAPTWSSNQAITLSTAAQPNITSVGTLTSLTVSGAFSSGAATVTTLAGTGAVSGFTTASFSDNIFVTTNGKLIGRSTNNAIQFTDATNVVAVLAAGSEVGRFSSAGLTVNAGYTTAVQALTTTTITTSGSVDITGTGNSLTIRKANNLPSQLFVGSAGNNFSLGYTAADTWALTKNDGATAIISATQAGAVSFVAGISATTGTFSGTINSQTISSAASFTGTIAAADTLLGLGYHSRARSVSSLNVASGSPNSAVLGTSAGSHGILLLECQKHTDINFRGSGAYWVVFSPASGSGGITRIGAGDVNGPSGAWPATVVVAANYAVNATVSSGAATDCFFHWYGGDWS